MILIIVCVYTRWLLSRFQFKRRHLSRHSWDDDSRAKLLPSLRLFFYHSFQTDSYYMEGEFYSARMNSKEQFKNIISFLSNLYWLLFNKLVVARLLQTTNSSERKN